MADSLTGPFAVVALVLCTAGLAKLRSPRAALQALVVLGVPARVELVRTLAAAEIALGALAVVRPSAAVGAAVAALFGSFSIIALRLARRQAGCGCFGDGETPASGIQSLLSAALACVGIAVALSHAHGVGWVLGRGTVNAGILIAGIAGAAYAVVLTYTQLPRAWSHWSMQ